MENVYQFSQLLLSCDNAMENLMEYNRTESETKRRICVMDFNVAEFYGQVLGISDPPIVQRLISVTELRHISKKEILIEEGKPLSYISFILSGIFRGFFLDVNGRDITDCFGFRYGEPAVSVFSLDSPSTVTIEALTEGELLCIPAEEVTKLMKENSSLIQVYNRLLVDSFQRHWEIKNILHKQTARERYQWFLNAYPGLIDHVTHRYIASFLEMSPVTLSRLRSADKSADRL